MFLLVVSLLLLISSCIESREDSTHLSEILKLKCDALPYRTAYSEYKCYFAVLQEIDFDQANEKCSSIFLGAKRVSTVPAEILSTLMVDKSKFYLGRDSSGKRQIICTVGSDYKCDSDSKMLEKGRCIMRAENKMNFADAQNYCGEQGMEIPAPENDLDNRILKESLMKDPAWVRKMFDRRNGNKWSQGRNYSRWNSCNKPNEQKCSKDTAVMIDSTGYWSTEETGKLMDVICITNAGNDFTKGASKEEPCLSYHEIKGLPLLAPATFGQSITCYVEKRTTTRYQAIGKATVETRRGCEVLCDSKPTCSSFSFEDKGLTSSCILLSSKTSDQTCTAQTMIFMKNKYGCPKRDNTTVEFGEDPCIEVRNDTAFRGFGARPICDPDKSLLYVIRAIDVNGRRITLDNEIYNYMRKTDNGFFGIGSLLNDNYLTTLVAFTCAIADDVKCPCERLKLTDDNLDRKFQGLSTNVPKYAVTTDRVNPCNSSNSRLWVDNIKLRAYDIRIPSEQFTALAFITCKAGMWILYSDIATWAINMAACRDY